MLSIQRDNVTIIDEYPHYPIDLQSGGAGRVRWTAPTEMAASAAGGGGATASAGNRSSITNDDLLAQLAEAEMDEGGFLGGGDTSASMSGGGLMGVSGPGLMSASRKHASVSGSSSPYAKSANAAVPVNRSELPDSEKTSDDVVRTADTGSKTSPLLSAPNAPSIAAAAGTGSSPEKQPASVAQETTKEETIDLDFGAFQDGADVATSNEKQKSEIGGAGNNEATPSASSEGKVGHKDAARGKPSGGTLEDELSQLEELERELGIMGVTGSGSAGAKAGARDETVSGEGGEVRKEDGGDDSFDMDNLDELEGYLESLAK